MSTIFFITPQLDCRGTCVAIYDYADYNERLLGGKSYIGVPVKSLPNNEKDATTKFMDRFTIFFYSNNIHLATLMKEYNCDIYYVIKYGKKDDLISPLPNIKSCIHCVFDMTDPHGNVYAGVSETLARKFNKTTYVPHMISLIPNGNTHDLRVELGIPRNAVVFGRYGGFDTFNLGFVHETISKIIKESTNIYFLFMNTPQFVKSNKAIFLQSSTSLNRKRAFIQTCDAWLEGSTLGHTFGIAIGEANLHNIPVIAYNGNVWNRAYLDILGDKGIYFKNPEEFENILKNFTPEPGKNWVSNYRNYTPNEVMRIFKKVFID